MIYVDSEESNGKGLSLSLATVYSFGERGREKWRWRTINLACVPHRDASARAARMPSRVFAQWSKDHLTMAMYYSRSCARRNVIYRRTHNYAFWLRWHAIFVITLGSNLRQVLHFATYFQTLRSSQCKAQLLKNKFILYNYVSFFELYNVQQKDEHRKKILSALGRINNESAE